MLMKTFIFFVSLMFAVVVSQAQDYQISFTGSGQSTSVDSIQVKNLAQETTLSLNGDDVLHLVKTLGINAIAPKESALKIYPNPMMESTVVEFFHTNTAPVNIEIFNETGVLVVKQSLPIPQGKQRFEISGLNTGIYTVNVQTADLKYIAKLISLGKNTGNVSVEYQGSGDGSVSERTSESTKSIIQMQYNDGEMLLFKGFASNFTCVFTLLPIKSQSVDFEFILCPDEDGHNYSVVTIGTQTWMAENLNYETENGLCYDYDTVNCAIYGRLYTWDVIMNGEVSSSEVPSGVQGICPSGWHIPSDAEWKILEIYLGMSQTAANNTGWRGTDEGGKLKEEGTAHWISTNTGATNSSGFTALPGGVRGASFFSLGLSGFWWTATETSSTNAWYRKLSNTASTVERDNHSKSNYVSVRCLKD